MLLSFDPQQKEKLRGLLNAAPQMVTPFRQQHGGSGRAPVLVRCTSATAAGGTEVGHDQCYPAKVLNVNSLVDEQAEEALVWLTLLDGGSTASPVTVAVPVAGNAYYGVFSGSFDPFPSGASDPRPRVFAIARAASGALGTYLLDELGGGSHFSWSSDNTWVDVTGVEFTSLAAGLYLFTASVSGGARLSAGGPEWTAIRLWNNTDSTVIPGTTAIITQAGTINQSFAGCASVQSVHELTGTKTIRLQVFRTNLNTSTWNGSSVNNNSLSGSAPGGTYIWHLRLS